MKFRYLLYAPIILLFFSALLPEANTKAQETDYVAAAVAALQTSNIYVHPGTPGTDFDTTRQLSTYMSNDSQVVLVILPFDALEKSSIETLARDISKGLDNNKTVGLAVGPNLVGYSTIVPDVGSMMQRASSVSNSPVTALVAFSQSVQLWYDSNPQPTPTPTPAPTPTPRPTMQPIDVPETSEVPSSIWIIFIIFFVIFTVFLATSIKKARDKQKLDSIMSQIDHEDF